MPGRIASIASAVIVLVAGRATATGERIHVRAGRAELPGGLSLVLDQRGFAVKHGKLRAPIEVETNEMLVDFRVAKGAGAGELIVTIIDNCDETHRLDLTVAGLRARVENAAALSLHRQRRWGEAAAGFARALGQDPTWAVAAANLASAQVMDGKPDDAVKTVAPLLAQKPVAMYARLVADPELAPLLQRPEIAAARAPAPGTARLNLTDIDVTLDGAFAVSGRYRLIAAVQGEERAMTCGGEAHLVLLDLKGIEIAHMPLHDMDDATDDEKRGCPFKKSARPRIAARVAAAQRLLTDLGFSPTGEAGLVTESSVKFGRAKIGVVIGPHGVRALRGDRELGAAPTRGERFEAAAFLDGDGYDVIVFDWVRSSREGCEGIDPSGVQVLPIDTKK